jgi:hypothetical protein
VVNEEEILGIVELEKWAGTFGKHLNIHSWCNHRLDPEVHAWDFMVTYQILYCNLCSNEQTTRTNLSGKWSLTFWFPVAPS